MSKLTALLRGVGKPPSVVATLSEATTEMYSRRKLTLACEELLKEVSANGLTVTAWLKFFKVFSCMYATTERRTDKVHPSSIATDCSRKVYYDLTKAPVTNIKVVPKQLQRIFDVGHFYHSYIQARLYETKLLQAMEVPVISEEYFISGKADGVLKWHGQEVIVEIKTINSFGFGALKAPTESHYIQASIYAELLGVDYILFLYINKDTSGIKEYYVKKSEAFIEEAFDKIADIKYHMRKETPPERECDSINCAQAKTCPYKNHCFHE